MKLARYAVAAVLVVALGELALHLWFAYRPPNEAQWRAARAQLVAIHKPGDLVVVGPQWAEPIARMVLGDEYMSVRDVARPDETRYAAAMEISILGQHSKYVDGWRQLERHRIGKFEARRLENPHAEKVLYDFVDHIGPSDVTALLHDEQDKPCAWSDSAAPFAGGLGGPPAFPERRFVCPAPLHVFVGVTVVDDESYMPRRCIMMHAPANGYVEARFRDVPLGQVIRGHSGMRMMVERELSGTPISLEVFVDGQKVGEDVHVDGDGWKAWRILLGARAGQRGEVTFRVSSSREAQRQMCWEADAR